MNVLILNEAGTADIATGTTDYEDARNVNNINNPGVLVVNDDYLIQVAGFAKVGRACTGVNGNSATFS